MRVLGLDVGSKTIGVAVSDELGLCAHALQTLSRRGTKADVVTIVARAASYGVRRVVVGLPYDCEGNEGHRAARVRVLGDALSQAGLDVVYQDESYSTVAAEEVLLAADVSRARRKQVIDRLAAAVILQAWLDAQRAPADSSSSSSSSSSSGSDPGSALAAGGGRE
ncbi:MAG: Holliday junction resolvase RuvX [Polyangia bacterium]